MPVSFSSIKYKLRLLTTLSLVGLFIIGFNSISTRATTNNFSFQIQKIFEQREVLRSLKSTLQESKLLLNGILFQNDDDNIQRLLALNEDTLNLFELFKSSSYDQNSESDYFFSIENEPLILQLRKYFYRCIALYRAGKKDEAIKFKLNVLDQRSQHFDIFFENSEDLQAIQLKDLQSQKESHSIYAEQIEFVVYTIIFLLSMIILYLGESISRSIVNLTDSVLAMVRSDQAGERVPVDSKDEVGTLATSFNSLIAERNQAQRSLLKLNEELEQRVKARTAKIKDLQQDALRKERLVAVGQVTATVSHELRNPLGTIRTSLYSLNKKLLGNELNTDKVIARIERNVDRCDNIIGELLDFSRVKELNLELTAIDAWLKKVIDEYILPEEVTLKCELVSVCKIDIDRDRFRRVIINIMDNAVHALTGEAQSASQNRDRIITVKTHVSDDWIIISVIDTGPGISADIMGKVFEPLFSTKNFGVGLGLPMVQNIMVQHGGEVTIDCQKEKGTQVALKLPLLRTKTRESV